MIICFNNKINNFNEKNLKSFSSYSERNSYIQSLMPDITDIHRNICPCCHAKNKLIKYGKYERNISILVNDTVENYRLSVQMIYTYIAIVLAFFDDFKILNNSKEYYNPQNFNEKYFFINCVNLSQADYRFDFFEFYNWLLFMQKFRNNVSPPITISISKVPPT